LTLFVVPSIVVYFSGSGARIKVFVEQRFFAGRERAS